MLFISIKVNNSLQLSSGGAVEASSSLVKIVEDWEGWIGLDGVVSFDPRKGVAPVVELSLGLCGVIEKAAGLQIIIVDDVWRCVFYNC